ncbi:hypothetical protein DPMN_171545 [Dreissena polymorpha]|uniref:Uncharacterized protein n=1 Tax=Dreissena polymorpha TaxID=45954 RepID=A0A9D4E0I8_DREPO|nr:hypothetical protein DPMN_171545 [Dreissena polymorpha]
MELDPHRRAMEVVTHVMTNHILEEQRFLAPKQKLLKRALNRHRAKNRPEEPTNLDFEVCITIKADLLTHQLTVIQ